MDLSILGSCCWFFFVARIQQLSFCSFSFSCLSSCCQIRFVLSPIPARLIRSCSGALSPAFLRFLRRLQCLAKEFAVFSPFRLVSSARSARPGAPAGFCSREQDAGEDFLQCLSRSSPLALKMYSSFLSSVLAPIFCPRSGLCVPPK
jgi:hypothetical protein